MKKILMLLGIAIISTNVSLAIIDDSETSDIDILRSQGYSESTLRAIDTVKSMNQGPTGSYKKHFYDKKSNFIGKSYTRLKNYVDPAQDDNLFGIHQINFTNNFYGNETEYATRKTDGIDIENL